MSTTKRKFPPGPWTTEPDHEEWTDEATGLRCVLHRVDWGGFLCGYVGVPDEHPAHGTGYDDLYTEGEEYGPAVHGGLTYAASTAPGCDAQGFWWFGFDCTHYQDLTPSSIASGFPIVNEVYRDVDFVRQETAHLAAQMNRTWPKGVNVHLPAAGPQRDRLITRMRSEYLPKNGSESREAMEAAYDALRVALTVGQKQRNPEGSR